MKTACVGTAVVDGELVVPIWKSAPQNFDDFVNAMLTLLEIFSLEAWPDIMVNLVDATDVNHGPSRNSQPIIVFFFVILIMLGSFFLLNLFVGVIVTAYNEAQRIEVEKGISDHDEVSHSYALELVGLCKPKRIFETDNIMQKKLVLFCRQPKFEITIMSCILLNVFVMCIDWVGIDQGVVDVTDTLNAIFMWVFTAECVLKLTALDWHYFLDGWNVFDFIVVVMSLVEKLSPFDFNPTIVRIFRVFRLARLLKLSRKAKGIQALVKTFESTLPSLMHVGCLLMIFFFMYAVLGVQLFCNVKHGKIFHSYIVYTCRRLIDLSLIAGEALGRHADFSNFGISLFTLFRMSSGENWNVVMHDLMVQPPHCTPMGQFSMEEC